MAKRSTRSRNKATRKRMLRENRAIEYEAANERYVRIDGEESHLPAYGWGETQGELPGWKSPERVAPLKVVETTPDSVNVVIKVQGRPVEVSLRKLTPRRFPGESITRTYRPNPHFCRDCYAQLQPKGNCPNGCKP